MMKLSNNLQAKILVFILSTVLIVFVIVGLFVGVRNRQYAVEKAHEYTQLMADKNARHVETLLNKFAVELTSTSNVIGIQLQKGTNPQEVLSEIIKSTLSKNPEISELCLTVASKLLGNELLTSDWALMKTNNRFVEGLQFVPTQTSVANGNSFFVSEPIQTTNGLVSDFSSPIFVNGDLQGYLTASVNLGFFGTFIKESYIFEGGFITVMSNSGVFVAHSNSGFLGRKFSENFSIEEKEWNVESKVAKGSQFELLTKFQRNSYYSYFVPVKIGNAPLLWTVEVTVPMHKILEASNKSILNSIFVALIGFVILIFVIWYLTNKIISPVKNVTGILELLSKGNTRDIKPLGLKSGDELQLMSDSLEKVVDGLRVTEGFALGIGKGNLTEKYELLSSDDQLGRALLNMRDSLKHSREEEEKRKREEEIRNWATQGIAKFAEILRNDSNQMKKLGYNLTENLVNYLDVNQGAFFVLNNDLEDDIYYELVTAIAYGRDKFMKKEIRVGEGLVGRCAFERKTVFLTEVPDDYANITSGLGTANPTCILIVPCILNEEVFGVIEIASFRVLQPYEIEFVEKLGESIAATISNVKINEKTSKLLAASQHQSEELAAQEEELRQNLEEMEATQEDLKRQMETNEQLRINMQQQAALLDSLLNSLPDYIYFKDKDSKFLRISKSMLELFNAKTVADVIGKSDFDYHTPENARKFYEDEQNIIRNKKGITDQLQKEVMIDGSYKWMSVTKLPLITEEGDCIGTFGISKDVTALKNLEIEAIKKNEEMSQTMETMKLAQEDLNKQIEINSKMRENEKRQNALLDALLNSLPDYIYFKDEQSRFLKISKSLISLFGAKTVDDVIGKSDFDYHTPENAQKYFDDELKIMQTRKGIVNQLQREILPDGSVIWNSITKLPLLTNQGECIGTFGISKNVTDVKTLEIEAQRREAELNGVLNAVKASTYTVEYDMQGKITDVNDAFVKLLKIKKEEIIGSHHKDGYDKNNISEKEYKQFWADLKQGKICHQKNHLQINDVEVWLSETYTPIKDSEGNVDRIFKIAFDITEYMKKNGKK
ncbi:MAG: PAS domain-containing protein [Salinivirgaceae bacterium]|nr:PAS domain-containing protein [Salinivirgaceae bacterium]